MYKDDSLSWRSVFDGLPGCAVGVQIDCVLLEHFLTCSNGHFCIKLIDCKMANDKCMNILFADENESQSSTDADCRFIQDAIICHLSDLHTVGCITSQSYLFSMSTSPPPPRAM